MKTKFYEGSITLKSLNYDMIFVEERKPILFTCLDDTGKIYICNRSFADAEQVMWIVVPTTNEAVIGMLTDILTIHDIFVQSNVSYIITLYSGKKKKEIIETRTSSIPENYLPASGYYMEADPGEFDDEIRILTERMKKTRRETSFRFYVRSSNLTLNAPHRMLGKISTYRRAKPRLVMVGG